MYMYSRNSDGVMMVMVMVMVMMMIIIIIMIMIMFVAGHVLHLKMAAQNQLCLRSILNEPGWVGPVVPT